jgi:hypothetical protein
MRMGAAQFGAGRNGRPESAGNPPDREGSPLRLICYAGAAVTVAGAVVLTAAPAFASGPATGVTPSTATPGASVTFTVTCGSSASSATLFGTTLGLSEQIPMQPSTHAGEFATTVHLPTSIRPGTYKPSIDCSNGSSGTATLVVASPSSPSATPSVTHSVTPSATPSGTPSGAPATGDGATSTTMGGPFEAAGLGLLGLGGLAGVIAFGRRRR